MPWKLTAICCLHDGSLDDESVPQIIKGQGVCIVKSMWLVHTKEQNMSEHAEPPQRSCTGLGAKPQDMTALSIDYVIILTGGTPGGGRCHTNVNTIEKLCIVLLFFLFLLNKSNT